METKKERLDRLEANLSIMSEIMAQLMEQQKKQLEEEQQKQIVEEEPTIEVKVNNMANKISEVMEENKSLQLNDIIELIQSYGLTKVDSLRIADKRHRLYFIEPINHNIIGFTIDTELRWAKATLLY